MNVIEPPQMLAKILTVSDGVIAGTRENRSGRALDEFLSGQGFSVVESRVSPDGTEPVAKALMEMANSFAGVIVTTGGTGFSRRDLTPEATRSVIEREAPGFAEYMRAANRLGMLSRGVAGCIGGALILNTPGSPNGCVEMLSAVIDLVPHAVALLSDPAAVHPKTTQDKP